MKLENQNRGFVALMSVIIISAILLIYVYLLSASSLLERFDALDGENKRESLALAEACVNAGILKMAQSDYSAQTVTVDASDPKKVCEVCSLDPSGSVLTRARYNSSYTNLVVTVDTSQGTYPVTAWQETPLYTGAPGSCPLP